MAGLTIDTGAPIALERQDHRVEAWLQRAVERGVAPSVPAVALAESWRGGARSALLARALRFCQLREIDEALARAAGELLARVGGSATIDALVVATAARHGGPWLTFKDSQSVGEHRRRIEAACGIDPSLG